MKLNKKLIAIPAIAITAGLGLAACGTDQAPAAAHNNAVVSQLHRGRTS